MPIYVKVRTWGNGLGIRLPKSFTTQHGITIGDIIKIDNLNIVNSRVRRRSGYRLKDIMKHYTTPPKGFDFPAVGKEIV